MADPALSIIVAFHNMAREAPRTLFTLSTAGQRGVVAADYEVVAVDVGSVPPLDERIVAAHGSRFRLVRAPAAPSPAAAMNAAVQATTGAAVAVCIDGARMLSPGIVRLTLAALRAYEDPVVATLAWHLGPKPQNKSLLEGYDQTAEDRLLASVDWRADGYELFRIASLGGSSAGGWFAPLPESNFVAVRRAAWERLGGLDERFRMPGGGLVNLAFYRDACERLGQPVILLGEGTFHQYHGGVATNVAPDHHPWPAMHAEYVALTGRPFACPKVTPEYLGGLPPQAERFLMPPRGGERPALSGLRQRSSTPAVLFLSGTPGSVGHVYRVEHASAALAAHGWRSIWLPLDDPAAVERLDGIDLVVVYRGRWGGPFAAMHDRCRARGIPVVYDIDDLIFDPVVTAAGQIAYLDGLPAAERARWVTEATEYRTALERCDAAILTTGPLAAAAAALCPRSFILPNALDQRMEAAAVHAAALPKPSDADGRLRLLFASGSPSHHRDFAVAAAAIGRLFARRPEPKLVIVGHFDPACQPALAPFIDRIERRPAVPFGDLPGEVARGDVNLCPLEMGSLFCEAKSAVRWLVAAAVGVPTIASPTAPLTEAVVDGVTGVLATDVPAWTAAIERLLDDHQLRQNMGAAARADAVARFGWESWSTRARDVYAALLQCVSARPA